MSEGHRNIPIFIPHLGCPNQCVFCNQRSISGKRDFRGDEVREQIEQALTTLRGREAEIAFFGGSFTGIDRDLMLRLLTLAERYVRTGEVRGIRLSTRPDYISEEILDVLSAFSVTTVELGLQSMDDAVLAASKRGHTAADAARACRLIKARGFSLVGQMMIGLPGASGESERRTAEEICALGADACRVYPTVVFYDTPLCDMAREGTYEPLSLEAAIGRSADVLEIFALHGVPCIRAGLCATEELTSEAHVYKGPNHPALGELIKSELYYRRILRLLKERSLLGSACVLTVPKKEISQAIGQHRANLSRLMRETETRVVRVVGADGDALLAERIDP